MPVRKCGKNGRVLLKVTRKGARATENVKEISHAAAQRRDEDGFRCAVASLREKSSSVPLIDKKDEVAPDIGFDEEVVLFDRLPRGRAGVRLR